MDQSQIPQTSSLTIADGNGTISLADENAISKLYEKLMKKELNLNDDNLTITLEEYSTASKNVVAGITTVATILAEGGKTLNVNFEASQSLNEELKVNISKYDTFVKGLSNAPYFKMVSTIAGLGLVTYFGWKMGLMRKVPSMFEHLLDLIPTSTPIPGGTTPVTDAVNRTLDGIHQNATTSDFMDLFKSPIMPIFTVTVAAVSLTTLLVVAKSTTRIIKLIRKLK